MAGGNVPANLVSAFQGAAAQYHVPANVLAGVASVESSLGQDRSTSSAGAVGLMQFLPSTAQSIGINPLNDQQAIYGAAKLLNQYGYQQNPLRALGAYNGGPGNPQYSYANQVMSEAQRLKGQLAGSMPSPSLSQAPKAATPATPAAGTLDQAAYGKAVNASIAGRYVAGASKGPWDFGPKTGLPTGKAANPLFQTGQLTTSTPNPADYQTAQNALQKIAGSTPLNQHPLSANLSGSGYVNPLPGATWGRTDMGVDAHMANGAPIKAIGDSKVVQIFPNWYAGQPYVLFQLLNGPQSGKYYYVSEAINPTVQPGQTVRAGQTIGTFNSGGTGLELGWGTSGWQTASQASGSSNVPNHSNTAEGRNFRNFLNGLGAHA